MRVVLGTEGWTGHVFPALALGRELRRRGHEVMLHSSERWAGAAGELGMGFAAAPDRIAEPGSNGAAGQLPSIADTVRDLVPALAEFGPDVVVSDLFSVVPALAADVAGVPRATLVPHVYTVDEPGLPFYLQGLLPPRGPLGRLGWRAVLRARLPTLRRGRDALNELREELGLAPQSRLHGAVSERLVCVATFPQFEYERRWPSHVHVTGPMFFDLPGREIELPEGNAPLVLVVGSTTVDPESRLVDTVLRGLSDEPVRVVATTGGRNPAGAEGPNVAVIDWGSNDQLLSHASLVVSHGGHGTMARALAYGVPVLAWADAPDMAGNSARVAWSGAGLMLPGPFLSPRAVRAAIRTMLSDPRFADRAAEFAAWSRDNDGAERGADLIESTFG